MFRRIDSDPQNSADQIEFNWDGRTVTCIPEDTVASALLFAGIRANRSHPVTGEPRAPYCMMGICYECLVEIDGVPNQQACQVRVEPGMRVRPQRGARA